VSLSSGSISNARLPGLDTGFLAGLVNCPVQIAHPLIHVMESSLE
jgi:hypothetical protein